MRIQYVRERPEPWADYAKDVPRWLKPLHRLEWYFSWVAWALGCWSLPEILEYLGSFSLLFAVILYFADSGHRIQQMHYQAWEVINSAQGKGGNGGRIDALEELNSDHVSLVGVDASVAFLYGLKLPKAKLARCNLQSSDLRESRLDGADMTYCDLRSANFRHAQMNRVDLSNADLTGADLHSASLSGSGLEGAVLDGVDLRGADLSGVSWQRLRSLKMANVYGVRHAPEGFLAWALAHGAVSLSSDAQWQALEAKQGN